MINLVAKQYSAQTNGIWVQSSVGDSQRSVLWSKRKQNKMKPNLLLVVRRD